jgi:hypothetical protein
MSCDIGLGRLEVCKDTIGGLKAVYLGNFGDIATVTYDLVDTDVIDAVTGTPDAFKYELKGTSSFTETVVSSRETGTTYFEQVLELSLKKLTPKMHKELKLMSFGRLTAIVEDNNGNFFLAGLARGLEVTGGSVQTGAALADMNGYSITLTGEEPVPANFLDAAPASVGFTVVVGT